MRKLWWVLLILLISTFAALPSLAQNQQVEIIAKPLFQITENLCPENDYCGRLWRLSPSGNRLFVYFVESYQLYTIDANNLITQYDLSAYQGAGAVLFDFEPYSETSILLFNGYRYELALFDLNTLTISDYLPAYSFAPCNNGIRGNDRSFVRSITGNWLVVCLRESSRGGISVVDLSTDSIYEIDTFSWSDDAHPAMQPWQRVYVGSDGTVYLIPSVWQGIFPDYVSDYTRYTIAKRSPNDSVWSRVDIYISQTTATSAHAYLGHFINIDSGGNMYFYTDSTITNIMGWQYTKINSQGELIWLISSDILEGNPFLIDINTNGELIMIDSPNDTTLGAVVSQYEIRVNAETASR